MVGFQTGNPGRTGCQFGHIGGRGGGGQGLIVVSHFAFRQHSPPRHPCWSHPVCVSGFSLLAPSSASLNSCVRIDRRVVTQWRLKQHAQARSVLTKGPLVDVSDGIGHCFPLDQIYLSLYHFRMLHHSGLSSYRNLEIYSTTGKPQKEDSRSIVLLLSLKRNIPHCDIHFWCSMTNIGWYVQVLLVRLN